MQSASAQVTPAGNPDLMFDDPAGIHSSATVVEFPVREAGGQRQLTTIVAEGGRFVAYGVEGSPPVPLAGATTMTAALQRYLQLASGAGPIRLATPQLFARDSAEEDGSDFNDGYSSSGLDSEDNGYLSAIG